MNVKNTEKQLDKKLSEVVRKLGGLCVKNETNIRAGLPDRMCLMPGGNVVFVEVKGEGEKVRPLQKHTINKLRGLGFEVFVLDHEAQIDYMLEDYTPAQ